VKRRSGQIRNNYELPVLMTALYAFNRTGWICDPDDIEDRTWTYIKCSTWPSC